VPPKRQPAVHSAHRDACLGEQRTTARRARRLGQREAVAFAGLHRQPQAEAAAEVAGPHPGAKNELVCFQFFVRKNGGADAPTFGAPAAHFGLPAEFHAGGGTAALQGIHQELRIEVAILSDVHGARDFHLDARLARGRRLGVEHFGAETERVSLDRRPRFFFECVRVAAKDQDAAVLEIEVVSLSGERDIERAARQCELDDER